MLFHEKVCIPLQVQRAFIRYNHDKMAHVGFLRLWKHLKPRYEWADRVDARKFSALVSKQCDVCQSCGPIPKWKIGMEPTLVPSELMTSVALDIFQFPSETTDEGTFDAIVLCVDRLSGWIIAEPGSLIGLTGEWAARRMYKQWRMFGIPNIITSDQGSQFISAWWKTMAALLGIRMAYSQAYHHQANGRAEVAGRHVIDRLRLCNQETGEKWVDLLPHVLDVIHDTVGEGGYTPYQIVFGRERPMSGFPYQPSKRSEDAECFFKRMGTLRKAVADTLNKHHEKWAHYSKEPERAFKPGDLV